MKTGESLPPALGHRQSIMALTPAEEYENEETRSALTTSPPRPDPSFSGPGGWLSARNPLAVFKTIEINSKEKRGRKGRRGMRLAATGNEIEAPAGGLD